MEIIKNAKKYIGTIEGSTKHHSIIDGYNKIKPLPVGYKVKYTDQWCAAFVSFIASISNVVKFPYECSCPRMVEKAKKNKQVIAKSKKPKKGWLIIYAWNGKTPSHVGIIEKINGQMLTVIEGNYSNSVKRRTINRDSSVIYCYIKVTEGVEK